MSFRLAQGFIACCLWSCVLCAAAQDTPSAPSDHTPGKGKIEDPDPTRLDVARLPSDVATITRDLYAHGFFVEAQLGALGFVLDLGEAAITGPRLAVVAGYELATWVSVIAGFEGSLHVTKNRPPPARTAFEMAGALVGLKLSIPFNEKAALWASGVAGVVWTGGDVLVALGFKKANSLGLNFGGELGFDWHLRSLHHSIGLLGGARMYPSLVRDSTTIGSYGSLYVRYVF